jgi:hypothetical protein
MKLVLFSLALSALASLVWIDTADAGRRFSTELSGANEVPGPGDPDGIGNARLSLLPGREQVCFDIFVRGIELPATGAHIHVGEVDESGDVVVALSSPNGNGQSTGCVSADREVIRAILQNPDGYYVNVHSSEYPAGAVRGQLSR